MAGLERCAAHLRELILRADRNDLSSAQKIMLEHATAQPDGAARVAAVDELLGEIVSWQNRASLSPLQHAFATVTVAMIERTRLVVGPQSDASSIGGTVALKP